MLHLFLDFLGEQLYICFQDVNTPFVLTAPGDDQVCELLRRLDELLVHWLHIVLIMVEHHIDGTSSLHHIATDIPDQKIFRSIMSRSFL